MNQDIIKEIAVTLNVKNTQVESVLNLLSEGNTVPFIARYRKEATGALDEEQIGTIDEQYKYLCNLEKRRNPFMNLTHYHRTVSQKGIVYMLPENNHAGQTFYSIYPSNPLLAHTKTSRANLLLLCPYTCLL